MIAPSISEFLFDGVQGQPMIRLDRSNGVKKMRKFAQNYLSANKKTDLNLAINVREKTYKLLSKRLLFLLGDEMYHEGLEYVLLNNLLFPVIYFNY